VQRAAEGLSEVERGLRRNLLRSLSLDASPPRWSAFRSQNLAGCGDGNGSAMRAQDAAQYIVILRPL